ncbi:hypothetical protein GGI23_002383 [Coemansia sp. RSA 2559]|nr:hypothetical protein GGI23_002383 [Coemansia sp. RSA 2559]
MAPFKLAKPFEQRKPSAETLQINYEQTMAGVTAGLFCAGWAARLLGIPIVDSITTLSHEDPERHGYYYFGLNDVYLAMMVACKMLFVRALLFRYVLRPSVSRVSMRYFGRSLSFENAHQIAIWIFSTLILSASVLIGLQFANLPLLLSSASPQKWAAAAWDGYPAASVPLLTKLLVLCAGAGRMAKFVTDAIEEQAQGWFNRLILTYLVLGLVSALSTLGLLPVYIGALVLACDLPSLAEAAARGVVVLSRCKPAKCRLALGAALSLYMLSVVAIMPLVIYTVTWGSPDTVVPGDQPNETVLWTGAMQKSVGWLSVGSLLAILANSTMAAQFWVHFEATKTDKLA